MGSGFDGQNAVVTQPIDAAFIRGKIGAGESTVVDPGALSDHKWLGVKLILGGSAL